jgi:hypothetical protein
VSDGPVFLDLNLPDGAAPPDPDALREQAATALERASHFVAAHGGALAQGRTWALLEAQPVDDAVACLAAQQRDDGSFPSLVDPPTDVVAAALQEWGAGDSLVGTLQALSMLADLRQLVTPAVDRAVNFVSALQLDDGSWGPGAGSAQPNGSGDGSDGRLFGTAMLTGMLGKTRAVRPDVLGGASNFVAEKWAPERVEGGQWSAIAAFANFFTNVHHELGDEALQWCGRELERGFRTRRFEALAVLRVLLTSDAAALPGSKMTPPELLAALLSEQATDGGFAELESRGVPARVEPTVDAILAILRLCSAF